MECVCIIDDSASIRETVAIVLGDRYAVRSLTPEDCRHDPSALDGADVLVLADDAIEVDSAATFARGIPILWLQSRATLPAVAVPAWRAIPRSFRPEELRAQVAALLAGRSSDDRPLSSWSVLDYPLVPQDIAPLTRRAAHTRLPVLICGEPGTGKGRLARAIYSFAGSDRFLPLSPTSCTFATLLQAGALAPGQLTLFLNEVAKLGDEAQEVVRELLDCGGFRSSAGWHGVRLICASSEPFATLTTAHGLDPALFYRLSVLPISLPPLRERSAYIPALVDVLCAELTRRLSAPPLALTVRARERLSRYLWFGNLAELETVLMRTLALVPQRPIDASDLLFGYGRIAPQPAGPGAAVDRPAAPPPGTAEAVDLIINELAHEFKNPMVTIKTVSQHLERLLGDEAGRQQVARLTGDAVDRMDRTLENLLQFTRFRQPDRQPAALSALLTPCLSELTSAMSERHIVLNYQPPDAADVYVDPAQLTYALDNMLRAIVRDLEEGQTLSIRPLPSGGGVTFEFSTAHASTAGKLAAHLEHPHNGTPALPLGFVVAKAVIERNGGQVDFRSAEPGTVIAVRLPHRGENASGNGTTAGLDR